MTVTTAHRPHFKRAIVMRVPEITFDIDHFFVYTRKSSGKLEKWGDNMKFWNKLEDFKKNINDFKKKICSKKICITKKICISIGLLLLPVSFFLHPVAAVQKIVKPNKKEQQMVAGAEEVQRGIPAAQGAGEPGTTVRERGSAVSRGGEVDRNSVYLLAQVIEGEAADEPYEGKVAVGAVILNRTGSPDFPNTIPGVVYEVDAFESVSNGQYQRPLSKDSLNAAVDALNGYDPTGGALYFWNPAKATSPWVWSRPVITRIGGHVFAR